MAQINTYSYYLFYEIFSGEKINFFQSFQKSDKTFSQGFWLAFSSNFLLDLPMKASKNITLFITCEVM
jgi:hypothetical protein